MDGKKFLVLPMATLALFLTIPATAAERFELGLFGGWSLPTLKVTHFPQAGIPFADELNQGFLIGARFGYRVRPRLVVEGAIGTARTAGLP